MTAAPVRVALVDHTAALSGAEIALARLIDALDRDRVEPVAVLFEDGPLRERIRATGTRVVVVPLGHDVRGTPRDHLVGGPRRAARQARTIGSFLPLLRSALRSLEVDVVHTTSLKADLLGGVAARSLRISLVWHVHDRIAADYLPARTARAIRWAARHMPDHVVANSRATAETLTPAPERMSVIHPGLPDSAFRAPRQRPANARSEPVIGMIGRISPTKGQDVFLRAAAVVAARYPMARFRIVGRAMFGDAGYEEAVAKLPASLGIADRVDLVGFADDPGSELARLDLLVHASPVPEPFGQVIVEAMAAGVPVVATDAGGAREIVRPPGCRSDLALAVPPGDVDALAGAIGDVLDEPAAAHRRAGHAAFVVRQQFSVRRTAAEMTDVWTGVARPREHTA